MSQRKRKPLRKPRYTVMYRRSRDDRRVYGGNKMTHSLIDTLFFEVKCLEIRPTQEMLDRVYKVNGKERLHMYSPSMRWLAFRRLQSSRGKKRGHGMQKQKACF